MAAQRTQLARTSYGSGPSPKTPSSTALTETVPLHITPLDSLDSGRDPNTPNKDSSCTYKKKSGKLVSKRKLFLQSGQNLPVNKAKRHAGAKIPPATTSTSKPADGGRCHFPLTERQQLQYLLEVTAREAKQDSGSSSNDDLPITTNRAPKKDTGTDNHVETRIRKRNERGETALHAAAIRGDLQDTVALIKAGALVNDKDYAGWTPLHEACNYGNLSIVQELVWSGAEVNSPGYEAITPLHDAVINDHVKVVKFLLENGADSKLQTSQNYRATDLARSEAVLNLLNQEEKISDCYSTESPSQPQYNNVNSKLSSVKMNGLNGSFVQESPCDNIYDHGFSFQGAQDVKVHLIPQESLEINAKGDHTEKQDFYVQSFPTAYGNVRPFQNDTEVSKEREVINSRSLCNDVEEKNGNVQVKCDYGAWHYQNSSCLRGGSEEMQLNGNAEVGRKVIEPLPSVDLVQDFTKKSTSALTCPNSLGPPVAKGLDQTHGQNLSTKKPCLAVMSDSEEDAVRPEKLNECLDKAMIEISSYLETSKKVDTHSASCNGQETDLNNCNNNDLQHEKNLNDKTLPNELVIMTSLQGPDPTVSSLHFDNCQEDRQYVSSSLLKRMEYKEEVTKVPAEEVISLDQEPTMNFSKIRLRSERKKDSGVSERSGKSVRRKRTSARSTDTNKYEQSINKEECTNHISNRSWRSDLPKYRHSLSALPLCVPGYEDFLINSKNRKSTSESLSDEVVKDPACENQLERLIVQHDAEKVKLRMTLEQELVRLFGNCARYSAGYQVPYSACSVISSQIGSPGMKQLTTVRGQPLSIKLEVERILGKFNRLKTQMLKRHNREIEVVFALENFWPQNEGFTGASRLPAKNWNALNEDFDLLPPKFHDYYEEVLCATD